MPPPLRPRHALRAAAPACVCARATAPAGLRRALRLDERGGARAASWAMLSILHAYRRLTDHWPPNCRFTPSCSKYMIEAITAHGAARGFLLSAWRLVRCNPTGGAGYDPVRWPPVAYRAGSWTE